MGKSSRVAIIPVLGRCFSALQMLIISGRVGGANHEVAGGSHYQSLAASMSQLNCV